MKILITCACILIMLFTNVSIAIEYKAKKNGLLSIQVSNLGPTRISMDNQKIMDAFYYPQESVKLILHQSGSAFVVPNEEYEHVYISLVGEDGTTQDLRLKFVTKQPEPIVIYFTTKPSNQIQGENKNVEMPSKK